MNEMIHFFCNIVPANCSLTTKLSQFFYLIFHLFTLLTLFLLTKLVRSYTLIIFYFPDNLFSCIVPNFVLKLVSFALCTLLSTVIFFLYCYIRSSFRVKEEREKGDLMKKQVKQQNSADLKPLAINILSTFFFVVLLVLFFNLKSNLCYENFLLVFSHLLTFSQKEI